MSLVPDHDFCRIGSHVYTVLVARWALRYTILLRTGYPIDRYPIHGAGALAYGEFPNRQAHYVMNDRLVGVGLSGMSLQFASVYSR